MHSFKPLFVGRNFLDPMDVYVDDLGRHAYLQLMIPMAKTFQWNGVLVSQSVHQTLPRFSHTAEKGTPYYALLTPFSHAGGILDSRVESLLTIADPILVGPFHLGVDGPAILFSEDQVVDQEAADEPDLA